MDDLTPPAGRFTLSHTDPERPPQTLAGYGKPAKLPAVVLAETRQAAHDTSVNPGGYNRGVMKFVISIYQDEDGAYITECPSIPGCVSQGQTEAEAEANMAEAIRESLVARAERGMPLTVTTREVDVVV